MTTSQKEQVTLLRSQGESYTRIADKFPYQADDLFIGFHCDNTPKYLLSTAEFTYHKIMARQWEPDREPDITWGTLEGSLLAGPVTLFRLQADGTGVCTPISPRAKCCPCPRKSSAVSALLLMAAHGKRTCTQQRL